MSAARSAFLRNALQGGSRTSLLPQRRFSSSAHHDDAYEAKKWERITYLGIASCTILASYILSKGHPHYDEPTPFVYLHVRNKEFPWGPDGLFEVKRH
ncbi:cytochrome c oxidase subunit 6a, mitochondrial-like [Tripterygium wilfordii]|uniref:cytochrome c oxidase subunit 6a, mitochondrial-like n=1 Tax=Tripterygium wilfordii TaxID=458696 RepID=UPI0018F7F300|nr:cytochrome c oxidase subunit 6a, mitochondrial-like [Tripterygium wilfordii]